MSPTVPSSRLIDLLAGRGSVLVLTGAGVSQESGIATFRDLGGLWEGVDPTQVATPRAFAADPELVWRFYDARRTQRRGGACRIRRTSRSPLSRPRNGRSCSRRKTSTACTSARGAAPSSGCTEASGALRCTPCGNEHEDLRPSLAPLAAALRASAAAMLRPGRRLVRGAASHDRNSRRAERACALRGAGARRRHVVARLSGGVAAGDGALARVRTSSRSTRSGRPSPPASSEHLAGARGGRPPRAARRRQDSDGSRRMSRERKGPLARCDRRRLGGHDPGRARRSRRAVSRRQARRLEPGAPRRAT